MIAFDFPSSPTEGEIYTPAGGPSFIYYAPAWRQVTTVQAMQLATAESRNRIVNGALQHSQENGDTAGGTSEYYIVDQWLGRHVGMTTFSAARSAGANPNQMAIYALKATLAAGDYCMFQQNIEGLRLADLEWGTVRAKQIILRFDAYGPAGTYCVSIRNGGAADRSFLAPFTLPTANTWTTITVVIPGDATGGNWAKTNASGMAVAIVFAAGSTFHGVAGWQAGNKLALATTTNAYATAQNCYLRKIGLYADPANTGIAPPWQEPDFADELIACQRYYRSATFSTWWLHTIESSATYRRGTYVLSPVMRANPAITITALSSVTFAGGMPSVGESNPNFAILQGDVTTVAGYSYVTSLKFNARM